MSRISILYTPKKLVQSLLDMKLISKEIISKLCYNYLYLGHGLDNVIMALFDVHQTLRESNEIQKFDT